MRLSNSIKLKMKSSNLPFLLILFVLVLTNSCTSDERSKAFVGVWQNQKNPNEKWEITQTTTGFSGKNLGQNNTYPFEQETWKVNADQRVIRLMPNQKEGTTLSYLLAKDQILRTPPGNIYVRVAGAE